MGTKVEVIWDTQDPSSVGWSYRAGGESGSIDSVSELDALIADADAVECESDLDDVRAWLRQPRHCAEIFDAPPARSGNVGWGVTGIHTGTPEHIAESLLAQACSQARASGEYEEGDRLYITVWDETGTIVAEADAAVYG